MRDSSGSHTKSNHTPDKVIDNLIVGWKCLDEFMSGMKVFVEKPELKYSMFNYFVNQLTGGLSKVSPHSLDSFLPYILQYM